jgi:hypothetical protein
MLADTAEVTPAVDTATRPAVMATAPLPAPTATDTPVLLAAMPAPLADTATQAHRAVMPQLPVPTPQPLAATATAAVQEWPPAAECAVVAAAEVAAPAARNACLN